MLHDLVLKNRSYRRFDESVTPTRDTLKQLCALARICPCGANRQVFKFRLSTDKSEVDAVFPTLAWAGYFPNGAGTPPLGERPTAYITIVHDKSLGNGKIMDVGIYAQTILLGASELGLGGCMIGSVRRDALSKILALDDNYEISLVIALGKPVETVVIENADGDIKYWRDSDRVHHVPKRTLDELIIG